MKAGEFVYVTTLLNVHLVPHKLSVPMELKYNNQ